MLQMSSALFVRFLLTLIVSLALTMSPSATYAAKSIDIGDAHSLPLGSTVTLKGTVTVPSGAFRSGSFDEGFAIQDKTGGIYVSIVTNLGLHIRDKVEVTGQLANSFGLLILVPASQADVQRKGYGQQVAPESLATNAINEATEGRLVQVAGVITQPVGNDEPYGYRLFVDDGSGEAQVFVYASTGIDVSGLRPGQPVHVIGFSGQFVDHYEINPRIPGDIQVQ